MKYDISCKVYAIVFSKLVKSYYKNHLSDVDVKPIIKAVKKEYKAMVLRTPGLSKDNFMASNLKGAAYFLALGKMTPNMTPELMDKMIDEGFKSKLMTKINGKKKKKGMLFTEKYQNKMYKDSLRSKKSTDEMDWEFDYHAGKDEIKYEMHRCGVCKLAQKENLLEYLPCLCKMDYPKYKSMGATLVRDKTLAAGDDCCNFHLIKDKE